jgi:hypothetical protein
MLTTIIVNFKFELECLHTKCLITTWLISIWDWLSTYKIFYHYPLIWSWGCIIRSITHFSPNQNFSWMRSLPAKMDLELIKNSSDPYPRFFSLSSEVLIYQCTFHLCVFAKGCSKILPSSPLCFWCKNVLRMWGKLEIVFTLFTSMFLV